MPYYFGEGEPGWDEYMERLEAENLAHGPLDRFNYVEPWRARGPSSGSRARPPPRRRVKRRPTKARASPQHYDPLIWLRITTSLYKHHNSRSRPPRSKLGSPEWMANFEAEQKRETEEALERVAGLGCCLPCRGRAPNPTRYDGGNDEGFTHFEALEMADGRRLTRQDPTARDVVRAAIKAKGGKANTDGFGEVRRPRHCRRCRRRLPRPRLRCRHLRNVRRHHD